jgi:arylsulfatase A-like enzyme
MSVSFKAPHVQDSDPRQFLYDPALEDLYADVTIPPPDKGDPKWFAELPEWLQTSEGRVRWDKRFANEEMYQRSVKGYYRLVTGVDRVIGRLRKTLEAKGIADNTVILFTSDHGFYLGERGLAGKWLLHEESIRAPFLVHDPRANKPGLVHDEIVLNLDVAPTVMDLAGVTPPANVQGRSVVPLAHGEDPAWRSSCFLEHHFGWERKHSIPASEGVRTETAKYIRYLKPEEGREECYNLAADPLEHDNLAGSERCATLKADWQRWRDQLAAWKPDPEYAWQDPELTSTKG